MRLLDILLAILVVSIWASNFVVGKICLETSPPFFLCFFRFSLTALLLLPFVKIPKGHFRSIFLLSITLGILHFALLTYALQDLDASTSAIAIQCGVPFSIILSAFFFKERISKQNLLGIIIALCGVFVLVGEPHIFDNLTAFLTLVVAAFFWAVSNLQTKSLKEINPFALNAYFSLFLAPQLLIISLCCEKDHLKVMKNINFDFSFGILYMALITTIFAYSCWHKLIGKYGISLVTPFNLLGPLCGTFLSWIILDETISFIKIIGGVIIITGVSILVIKPRRKQG